MKKQKAEILAAVIVGLVLPVFVLSLIPSGKRKAQEQPKPQESVQQTKKQVEIPVLLSGENTVMMDLDDYLVGVVLAEMPSTFETEALKAQAVVARTYTLKRVQAGNKHSGGVCTEPSCCQAYCSPDDYIMRGSSQVELQKVENAVRETSGKVLTYNGTYIEATYFSCSGGRTEDAVAVWGSDVPYLQSVESPGEEIAAVYSDSVSMSVKDFLTKLSIGADSSLRIGKITYTDGSGVETIEICGQSFKGTTVRQKLGLRSTIFQIRVLGDTVSITTKGYGHRVGMSQYGAQAMAKAGKRYDEILQYYYQGTDLGSI